MFFIKETEICNFAYDTAICSYSLNYEAIKWHPKLSNGTHIVINWFQNNSMVANLGKFQIMFLGSLINNNDITFIVENKHIKSNNEVKLLGITINDKLTLTKHISNLSNTSRSKENIFLRLL